MKRNVSAYGYADAVDEISETMAMVFKADALAAGDDYLLRCYHVVALLLKGIGEYRPGWNPLDFEKELRACLPLKFDGFARSANRITRLLNQVIVDPTYVAVSYWSPRDKRRHTVQYRTRADVSERKRILASSYAFYTLTLAGTARELYSTTQFTAEAAYRKRGVWVSYEDDQENISSDMTRWWHIPKRHHEAVLEMTRTDAFVNTLVRSHDEEELTEKLNKTLINQEPNLDSDLKSAREFIEDFRRSSFKRELKREGLLSLINSSQVFLNKHFRSHVSFEQALFMVMTNVLYNSRVCPCSFFYGFPVHVRETCCVMTIGTSYTLSIGQHAAIARAVSSIFAHPLFADFHANERELGTQVDPTVREAISKNRSFKTAKFRAATVCFWDIRGFSKLCSGQPQKTAEIAAFLNEFNSVAATIIKEHHGILDKFIGDGVMAIFGRTPGFDDNACGAIHALEAAESLRRAFRKLTSSSRHIVVKRWKAKNAFGLGCGMQTGEVLVGMFGTTERHHFTAIGEPVNLAARFEARSRPGQILLGDVTKKALGKKGHTDLWEITQDIKNIPGRHFIYVVVDKRRRSTSR